jgi:L-ascorbate metabolism protein UlaG (beta-lactamase superfamily)
MTGGSLMCHDRLACFVAAAAMLVTTAAVARPFFDPRAEKNDAIDADAAFAAAPRDPACSTARLVATGGATPRDAHTLAVRWAGFSNFELAYNGKVILLDAYYDRGGNYPSLGFAAADVKRADLMIIGHGHFDHMSDAASVGIQTGAPIVGAPLTTDKLASQKVPAAQLRTVTGKGSERLGFDGFTVEPILARHGQPDPRVTTAIEGALSSLGEPNPALEAEERPIRARGVSDPRVITEGTIAYLITLDDGFRIMYRDSGGRVTAEEKAAMARAGGVDLALVAVAGDYLSTLTTRQALEHIRTYRPTVYMPAHHDGSFTGGRAMSRATEPLFQAVKDDNPEIVTVSRSYREPVCFNTEFNLARGGR